MLPTEHRSFLMPLIYALLLPACGSHVMVRPDSDAVTAPAEQTRAGSAPSAAQDPNPGSALPPLQTTARGSVGASLDAEPQVGFNNEPTDDRKAIALTFDDGPDGGSGASGVATTQLIADFCKDQNIPATFFINTNNWANLTTSTPAQNAVREILLDGHLLGNHTVDHKDLTVVDRTEGPEGVEGEFAGVEQALATALPDMPTGPLNLVRAPFGRPLQSPSQYPNKTVADVGAVIARHGVHVGWSIDSKDYVCGTQTQLSAAEQQQCVLNNVQTALTGGASGIVLMHAVYLNTYDTLPALVAMLTKQGYHFVSVEDVITSKYGANSAAIMQALGANPNRPQP